MSAAAPPGSTICPSCGIEGPLRLQRGQVCEGCQASAAWTRAEGSPLVITRGDIAELERRRAGEAAGEGPLRRVLPWLPATLAAVCGAIGIALVVRALQPLEIRSLSAIVDTLRWNGLAALLTGVPAFGIGLFALLRQRKTRHHRRVLMILPGVVGIAGGAAATTVGLLFGMMGSVSLRHSTMPPREQLGVAAGDAIERIAAATVVVVAPGEDGDARSAAIGTGSVIARNPGAAWILTNSHVAMPYAGVGTFRDATRAQPVWVQLADGREGKGHVRWVAQPPLDVALVELAVDNPPEPVTIAPATSELEAGSKVLYVPLPYRDGWLVHHGVVERRERHVTPAGEFSLVMTTLPVQPGDSGSGLFDAEGRIVGLNTWTRYGGPGLRGISLPSETMRDIVDAVAANAIHELDHRLVEGRLERRIVPTGIR